MPKPPSYMPESAGEAFKHINAVTAPTLDDLKLMVYLEASGQVGYGDLANAAPNESVAKLLNANGREEVAHAHRVAKAIAPSMAKISRCRSRRTTRMRNRRFASSIARSSRVS